MGLSLMPKRSPTDTKLDKAVGARLRAARRKKGWSQNELSIRLGLQSETVSRYETGAVPLSLAMLFQVAKVLDVGPEELLGLTPKNARLSAEEVEVLSFWRVLDAAVKKPVLELLRVGGGAKGSVRHPPPGASPKKP